MINAEQIKAKLKNYAVKTNHTFQEELIMYAIERIIYRISISKYVENFTLKGGVLLYAVYDKNYSRMTLDVDLLCQSINNKKENIKKIFEEILVMKVDDALYYDIDSLKVVNITELKKYHGVNVSFFAYLDRTKVPVSIDIGFGDKIYPSKIKIDYPSILEMDEALIYAYSLESVIAEKLEAIVSRGYFNSRMKDLYDIYVIITTNTFKYSDIKKAIEETFENRKTNIKNIIIFNDAYYDDINTINKWNQFINKKKAIIKIELKTIISLLKEFLEPILNNKYTFDIWKNKKWKDNKKV